MELKVDLFIKIGLLIILGALAAKIGAAYLSHFLDRLSTGHKSKPHDIDAMIEAKKHMIRTGEYGGQNHEPPPLPAGAIGVKTEDLLKSQLKNPQLSEQQKTEIQKILTLFEESTWGGGGSFDKMRQLFSSQFKITLESAFFMRAFRFLNSRQLLLETKTFAQVENLVLSTAFLQKLINECIERQGPLLKFLSQLERLDLFNILRSSELLFLRQSRQADVHLYSFLLQTKLDSISELSRLPSDDRERILERLLKSPLTTPKELVKKILDEAQLFTSLSPMPKLDSNKDLEGAYKVLGIHENTSLEDIKKRYRQLALERHPDRLAGKNIPKAYQEMAHRNFTLIKQALDLVTVERKKNA